MQQNLRAALFFIDRDIKMAGYDPREKADAASNANNIAHVAEFRFAATLMGRGYSKREYVRYALTNDANGDGMADGAPCHLGRETGIAPSNSGLEPVADNIDAMELVYHLADGTVTTNPASPEDIRSIEISLLVRTDEQYAAIKILPPIFRHQTQLMTQTQQYGGPFNDSRQRKLLITEVKCRNLECCKGTEPMSKESGFTLVEVMIAIVVLMVGLLGSLPCRPKLFRLMCCREGYRRVCGWRSLDGVAHEAVL